MTQDISNNDEFAKRFINLIEELNTNDEIQLNYNINRIKSDLTNYYFEWMIEILNNYKKDVQSKMYQEDPDYIGHYLTECDALLRYLEILNSYYKTFR